MTNNWIKEKETILGKFDSEGLNKDNKNKLVEYDKIRKSIDGASDGTRNIDGRALYYLASFLKNKPYKKATQDDMIKFDTWLRKQTKESTACLYLMKIRKFYKYLFNPKEYKKGKQFHRNIPYPDNVSWFRTIPSNGSELPIEEILTDNDVKKLLDVCVDSREQTIICSLLDGGITEQELVKMKIRNVDFDKHLGPFFLLPKNTRYKTPHRSRKVQLFLIPSCTAYIRDYLNHHPHKNNPDAYFIYSNDNRTSDKANTPISEQGIIWIVKSIGHRSGIKKKIRPHILRHNSATRCAKKGFNEFMMRERFGWSKSSHMPSVYVHLAGADVDGKIKQILGIEEEEKPEDSILQPIICWNCGHENPCTNIYCGRCSANLKPKTEDVMTATDIGVLLQKSTDTGQLEKIIGDIVLKKLQEIEKKN